MNRKRHGRRTGAGIYMNYRCKGFDCNAIRKTQMYPGLAKTVFCPKCGATYDVTAADRLLNTADLRGQHATR